MRSSAWIWLVGSGLTLANTIKPGKRVSPEVSAQLAAQFGSDAAKTVETATSGAKTTDAPLLKVVKTIVPTNIFAAISKDTPDMLGLMFFTLLFGIMITLVPREQTATLLGAIEGLYAAVNSGIQIVMRFAP